MLRPVTAINQKTTRFILPHHLCSNALDLFGGRWIFGFADAYKRVVRSHDHDMARCTVWIVSRLRHHISRLWRFVRSESLNSTYYEKFEDFRSAIDECLDGLSTVHKGEMETLMTHRFQLFEDVPLLAA